MYSTIMRVRLLPLRHHGALLPPSRPAEDWLEGWLCLRHRDRSMGDSVPVLELNPPAATPGMAVMARLYAPELESFERGEMRVRGLEAIRLEADGPPVGVVQSWRIDLTAAGEGRLQPIFIETHGAV